MPATIDDVAKKAAVSTATVSRALRGLPNVAAATREHILEVAKALNYTVAATNKRSHKSHKIVATITPLLDQWFYSKVSAAAALELIAAGFDAVHYSTDSVETQTALIRHLLSQNLVDGCIVVSFPLESKAIDYFQTYNVPVVTLESSTPYYPSIVLDNTAAAELATRHLINLGHRRIGFIAGAPLFTTFELVPNARRRGYHQALQQAGIPLDDSLEFVGNDVYEGGAESMKHLLNLPEPPTAVFATSDEMAVGALKILRDVRLQVPEDFSVIGFDDNDISEYVGLTTIRQPVNRFGELAAEKMISCLSEPKTIYAQQITMSYELIIRQSTGPVRKES